MVIISLSLILDKKLKKSHNGIINLIKHQSILFQIFRYIGVGGFVYFVDLTVFLIGTAFFSEAYLWINILGKIIASTTGFFLHKYFTFGSTKNSQTPREMALYAMLVLGNTILATALLYIGVDFLNQPQRATKIMTDIVVIIISFVMSRALFFKRVT